MKRLLLTAILAAAVCIDAFAQQPPAASADGTQTVTFDESRTRLRRRDRIPVRLGHELRFGVGAYGIPGYNVNFGCYDYAPMRYSASSLAVFNSVKLYEGPLYYTGAYSLGYSYRFTRVIGFGLTVSYAGRHGKFYDTFDKSVLGHYGAEFITFMPMLRIHWLNGKFYSLYSAFGFGLTVEYEHENANYYDFSYTDTILTGQFTPLGITVGRRFFGFAEVGIGAQGCLICGLGYKF